MVWKRKPHCNVINRLFVRQRLTGGPGRESKWDRVRRHKPEQSCE